MKISLIWHYNLQISKADRVPKRETQGNYQGISLSIKKKKKTTKKNLENKKRKIKYYVEAKDNSNDSSSPYQKPLRLEGRT